MKRLKIICSILCGLLALALLVGTLRLCFTSLDAPARVLTESQTAPELTELWAQAICAGDYETAQTMMYGDPQLLTGTEAFDTVDTLFWDAFLQSLSCEFLGDCYATQTGLARDVKITGMDLVKAMKPLRQRTEQLMEQWVQELEYMDEVYDEQNNYRDSFVMKAVCAATEEILSQKQPTCSRELTLQLVYEQGQWWIVTEQALIDTLSGQFAGT